jgi:peptidyl-prolyl cis-trans isomerase-like 3
VIDGADSTLDAMEKVPVNPKHRPLQEIKLLNVSTLVNRWNAALIVNVRHQVTIHANPIADAQDQ